MFWMFQGEGISKTANRFPKNISSPCAFVGFSGFEEPSPTNRNHVEVRRFVVVECPLKSRFCMQLLRLAFYLVSAGAQVRAMRNVVGLGSGYLDTGQSLGWSKKAPPPPPTRTYTGEPRARARHEPRGCSRAPGTSLARRSDWLAASA
jgi:hypothetical protein